MSYQPGPQNYPAPVEPTSDERTMAMLAHLSAFAGFVLPVLGHIGGPLIILLVRGGSSPFVSYHAREALNFNITIAILVAISIVLFLVLIGFVLLPIVGIVWFIMTLVAAFKARDGLGYRYPFTLRLIPEH